jgi:2-polyprenyl-3-methyl-5-hydroxy-6-metoxy-1,4-benzoquinol methylase
MDRMPPVPESSAGPDFNGEEDGRAVVRANDNDSFAEAYTAETEANLINGYYTRPAVLDLAGDVAGRRILDVGCGSGPLSGALGGRGAVVTGPGLQCRDAGVGPATARPGRGPGPG